MQECECGSIQCTIKPEDNLVLTGDEIRSGLQPNISKFRGE